MEIKLPSYAQPGWGVGLNNFLTQLQSSLLSIQKEVDVLKGENAFSLLKFAGTGFADTGMKFSYSYKKGDTIEEVDLNTAKAVILPPKVTFKIEGGSIFLSATLTSRVGRLVSLKGEHVAKEFDFSSMEGTYALILAPSMKSNAVTYDLECRASFIKDTSDSSKIKIYPNLNTWLDASTCRLGIITVMKQADNTQIIKFIPAPFICTVPAGSKEEYLARPIVTTITSTNNLPGDYRYRLEGGSYINGDGTTMSTTDISTSYNFNFVNLSPATASGKFVARIIEDYIKEENSGAITMNDTTAPKFATANYDTIFSDKIAKDSLYAVYVTNIGEVIIRRIYCEESFITNPQILGSMIFDTFENHYPLFTGIGAVEVLRFYFPTGSSSAIFFTPNYNYGNQIIADAGQNSSNWNLMGLKAEPSIASTNLSTNSVYIIPKVDANAAEKVILNVSDNNPDTSFNELPRILMYNHNIYEPIRITGGEATQFKLIGPRNGQNILLNYGRISGSYGANDLFSLSSDGLVMRYNSENASLHQFKIDQQDEMNLTFTTPLSTGSSVLKVQLEKGSVGPSLYLSKVCNLTSTSAKLLNEHLIANFEQDSASAETSIKLCVKGVSKTSELLRLFESNTKLVITVPNLDVTGEITFTSDKRLKENIEPYVLKASNIIEQLPVYSYNLKGSNETTIGILAQDLLKVAPELVVETPTEELPDKLSIKETKLSILCIKAIQELQEEINNLKEVVYDLRKQS